ncbi:hypothetical protein A3A38_02325 [Candidatus Kaiserbacteria bacterium RIFCSPLOWO2_01_FULL_53_17]|uniref:Uncharacterized protein n=1 Tax=Candidatus Kaiserbacteria bacterium RIFCSPLOWO2_01_FULL_53_17 TaxID=1798511 RepID=A0A1F6EHX4_9BACT|nr:MAG: hypothetical protein A3A38_02325 [Candidatus Kaiserbacteria bacterium RIFCSPLOWO2_01_FULL_53_17]
MDKTMTPSAITAGQIGKIQELLGARLRKSRLPSEPVQQVLATQGDAVADEMLAAIRTRVEAICNMIVRHVNVNRARTPQEALKATGRNVYANDSVVKTMPKGEGDEAEVHFFKHSRWISDDDLEEEYEKRGLTAVDPYSLAAVNEADPGFADTHPNGTHWKDANGKWCYAAFDRWLDGRRVNVHRRGNDWRGDWWFAGLRK